MGKFSLLLIVALSLSGCELSGGPGGPEEAGAGLVILLPGAGGRAIDDPGNIGHEAVQRLLTYEISLAGPGGRTVNRAAAYGESLEFANLEAGEWILSANAFFRGHGNLQANDPASAKPEAQPKTLMLAAAETQEVPLSLDLAPALEQVVLIPDAATFKMIGDPPAAGGWFGEAKNFLLLADLVLDNWKGPAIQGDAYSSPQARAFFHGGGHTLTIRSFETAGGTLNCGLFTDAYLADFYDLKIVLDISAGNSTLVNYAAGGLTATGSNVTVKDVHVSGTLHVRYADTSGAWGGGIAGEITGGMVAASSSKLDLKMEYNGMGSSLGSSAGGLLGEMNGIIITESFFNGTVEGSRAGGILGAEGIFPASDPNIIKHCYSAGTVRGINPNGQAVAGGIAGDFDGASGSAIGACYSAAEVLSETPGSFNGYAGGIAGTLGTNGAIEDCLALNFPSITVDSPLSPTASRVVGDNNGTLSGNRARAGMELIPNRDPGIPSWTDTTHPLGADITLSDPPEAANFDNTELDTDEAWSVFAMPPEGWDYPYPVFPWQILEGIQP